MISYNQQTDPPAPFLQIMLANRFHPSKRITISTLLDTGSDYTAIPSGVVKTLKLEPTGRILLEDIKRQTFPIFTYTLRLTIADMIIPEMKVIATELEHGLLGRDLLNRFYLHLNGPELQFDLKLVET